MKLTVFCKKYFNSLRDENDEPIYSYNDEFLRHFVRQSLKGGRCVTLNQYYNSTFSDEVFNTISKELDHNGIICKILDKHFEYKNEHRKFLDDEYDSEFEVYSGND